VHAPHKKFRQGFLRRQGGGIVWVEGRAAQGEGLTQMRLCCLHINQLVISIADDEVQRGFDSRLFGEIRVPAIFSEARRSSSSTVIFLSRLFGIRRGLARRSTARKVADGPGPGRRLPRIRPLLRLAAFALLDDLTLLLARRTVPASTPHCCQQQNRRLPPAPGAAGPSAAPAPAPVGIGATGSSREKCLHIAGHIRAEL